MIIYKTTNKINGKCYIGQTIRSLEEREKQHLKDAKQKRYSHYLLYRAINKYGMNNFLWGILHENIKDMNSLNVLEQLEITIHDSYNNGYNMTIGGRGSIGKKHSQKTKEQMSKSRKGQIPWHSGSHLSESHKRNIGNSLLNNKSLSIPLFKINKFTNEILNEYPSIQEASRQTKICVQNIHKCLQGLRKSSGGFAWARKI